MYVKENMRVKNIALPQTLLLVITHAVDLIKMGGGCWGERKYIGFIWNSLGGWGGETMTQVTRGAIISNR